MRFFLQSYDANSGFRVKNHLLMDYRERCRQIHHTVWWYHDVNAVFLRGTRLLKKGRAQILIYSYNLSLVWGLRVWKHMSRAGFDATCPRDAGYAQRMLGVCEVTLTFWGTKKTFGIAKHHLIWSTSIFGNLPFPAQHDARLSIDWETQFVAPTGSPWNEEYRNHIVIAVAPYPSLLACRLS
jgi:hypothetical protein